MDAGKYKKRVEKTVIEKEAKKWRIDCLIRWKLTFGSSRQASCPGLRLRKSENTPSSNFFMLRTGRPKEKNRMSVNMNTLKDTDWKGKRGKVAIATKFFIMVKWKGSNGSGSQGLLTKCFEAEYQCTHNIRASDVIQSRPEDARHIFTWKASKRSQYQRRQTSFQYFRLREKSANKERKELRLKSRIRLIRLSLEKPG